MTDSAKWLVRCAVLSVAFIVGNLVSAQTIYEKEQVDKSAEPVCGPSAFGEFIMHNIRVPFTSKVEGIGGRVEVKGVIETDGSMSSLEIVNGLTPELNEEVIRVFGMFRGWRPAEKQGAPVRQLFTYALKVGADRPDNFNKERYEFEFYFDKNFRKMTTEAGAEYRLLVPVDKRGIPVGKLNFGTKEKKKWRSVESPESRHGVAAGDELSVLLGVPQEDLYRYTETSEVEIAKVASAPFDTEMPEYLLTPDGRIVRELLAGVFSKVYYSSGQAAKVTMIESGAATRYLSWYSNSLVRERYSFEKVDEDLYVDKISEVYDSLGVPLVVGGNGSITIPGYRLGQGQVLDGYQVGVWRSSLPDGTPVFEEIFEKGKLVSGTRFSQEKEYHYTKLEEAPYFKGGDHALFSFLGRNIHYPEEASRRRIQGKVTLSFTVETDGMISDLELINGVAPALDEEAKRVLRRTSGSWMPGLRRGMPVRTRYTLPVNFQLS
jgi:TonB family protein